MDKVRLNGLLGKIEDVFKTDAAPEPATDGIQVDELLWNNIEWGNLEENLRDNAAQYGFGRVSRSAPSGPFLHVTATVPFKGTGEAYAEAARPEIDVPLRIAAHQATVDPTAGTETITYAPRRAGFESATIHAYGGGLLFKGLGCRAVLTSVSILPNQIVRGTFDIWGVLADITEAALPQIAYPYASVQAPSAKNEGLTLNAFDPARFSSFELRQGTELPEAPAGNDPDGHAGYEPTDMVPTFVTSIVRPPFATFNPKALREGGTRFAWDIGPIGSAQYNQFTLDGPKARITNVPPEDERGFAMMRLECRAENTDEQSFDPYQFVFE